MLRREQIFEPFFTTKGERNSGLGISIVKKNGGGNSRERARVV
jgi:signal transduction histidine kinase